MAPQLKSELEDESTINLERKLSHLAQLHPEDGKFWNQVSRLDLSICGSIIGYFWYQIFTSDDLCSQMQIRNESGCPFSMYLFVFSTVLYVGSIIRTIRQRYRFWAQFQRLSFSELKVALNRFPHWIGEIETQTQELALIAMMAASGEESTQIVIRGIRLWDIKFMELVLTLRPRLIRAIYRCALRYQFHHDIIIRFPTAKMWAAAIQREPELVWDCPEDIATSNFDVMLARVRHEPDSVNQIVDYEIQARIRKELNLE